jgi:regulator of protease activity HflC (stomatin/prohibitin superfamily)
VFREIEFKAPSAAVMLPAFLILMGLGIAGAVTGTGQAEPMRVAASMFVIFASFVCVGGSFVVEPGEARVLVLFGTYKGTVKSPGWYWANPFFSKRKISLRVRNFETQKLKVNDSHSNPIEIGAVVVWKVVETAEALFEVDDYEKYVNVQSESALRGLATSYPYDAHETGQEALSTHTDIVSHALKGAIHDRLAKAGVEVVEARISHLAYSPEIAQAMLQRQQASAIIAARGKIVEGAVGMVENALELLSQKGIVNLDDERKAHMVSNLLVVLCSERSTQPVVNTGSMY